MLLPWNLESVFDSNSIEYGLLMFLRIGIKDVGLKRITMIALVEESLNCP